MPNEKSSSSSIIFSISDGKIAKSITPKIFQKIDAWLTKSFFLKSSGVTKVGESYQAAGEYRGKNKAVQSSLLSIGQSADQQIAGSVMDPNVFWSCTTCLACVEACPVGINHVDQIMSNRRNMVLMQGEMPAEAQSTLRTIETQANPFGPAEERSNWLADLGVKF